MQEENSFEIFNNWFEILKSYRIDLTRPVVTYSRHLPNSKTHKDWIRYEHDIYRDHSNCPCCRIGRVSIQEKRRSLAEILIGAIEESIQVRVQKRLNFTAEFVIVAKPSQSIEWSERIRIGAIPIQAIGIFSCQRFRDRFKLEKIHSNCEMNESKWQFVLQLQEDQIILINSTFKQQQLVHTH